MMKLDVEKEKAILNSRGIGQNYQITRYPPSQKLEPFINHYWIIHSELPKNTFYKQSIIPHPCVNMIIQKGNSRIGGVVQKHFSYRLSGKNIIFAVMFRPAGFYPFFRKPLTTLTNKVIPLEKVFSVESTWLEGEILTQTNDRAMVKSMEKFLIMHLPQKDTRADLINNIVDTIASDTTILKVDDLVTKFALGERSLQRLFKQYVGVGTKWIINRYRLQNAAEKVMTGRNLSQIALDSGYYDQSHFVKDFKKILGVSPLQYKRTLD